MLKKFFLGTLSSFVGTLIAACVIGLAIFVSIVALIGKVGMSLSSTEEVKKGSILRISLEGAITEKESATDFDIKSIILSGGERVSSQNLRTLTSAIRDAADNKNIKGIYLDCGAVDAGMATLNVLRDELVAFKKSGKPILAYGAIMTQGTYYVATAADSIFINPQGELNLTGLNGQHMFYKGLFDKLGVRFTAIKVGTFKSAVEPYIMDEMSQPARAQLDTLLGTMWTQIKDQIATPRKLTGADIDTLINRDFISAATAAEVKSKGLVDGVLFYREIEKKLMRMADKKKAEDLNFVSPDLLASQTDDDTSYDSGKQVAVLYAEGDIQEAEPGGINCHELVPVINDLADNDDVKALVLRVNSPGGSVYGSDQIADALSYFKSKGKPFVVSMGDYAASGGYWISADADRIFANPLTITGSIGIFGLIPDVQGLLTKLGINIETVGTNPEGNFPTLFTQMTPGQQAAMQKRINNGYDQFIKRVANGRHLPEVRVRTIAEGRVWSAITAQKLGLVDELGNLDDAVKWAARKAGILKDYKVAAYPSASDGIRAMLERFENAYITKAVKRVAGKDIDPKVINYISRTLQQRPEQARMMPVIVKL